MKEIEFRAYYLPSTPIDGSKETTIHGGQRIVVYKVLLLLSSSFLQFLAEKYAKINWRIMFTGIK